MPTWRDNHLSSTTLSGLKIPVDNSVTGGYLFGNEIFGPGFDTTAARSNDPRFYGVVFVNLKAKYSAPLDGTSHMMTQAAALTQYPNCGATGSIEQDTAAWLQAEYDLRMGPGGIIYLPDGSTMLASQTLYLQAAGRVWFHCGRGCLLFSDGCSTAGIPAIHISGANGGQLINPLHGVNLVAAHGLTNANQSAGGTKYTGYVSGAVAMKIENCIGADFTSVSWTGYDRPFIWGTNVYGICFRNWAAGSNNVGFNWDQTGDLNSLERLRLIAGATANNNVGMDIDAYYGTVSQGGSIFLVDNAFDYNIQLHLRYTGQPNGTNNPTNVLHVIGNHFETTGACSATAPRITMQGTVFFTNNVFFENDATHPSPAYALMAPFTAVSPNNNWLNVDLLPFLSVNDVSAHVRVSGSGNVAQNPLTTFLLLQATDGTFVQEDVQTKLSALITADPGPLDLRTRTFKFILNYSSAGNFTLQGESLADFPIGTVFYLHNINSTVLIQGTYGLVVYNPSGGNHIAAGGIVEIHKYASNTWMLVGSGLS